MELANAMASLINGKHRFLPIFYCARDANTSVPTDRNAEYILNLADVQKHDPNYYQNFVTIMADFYSKKHSITKNEAKLELEKFLQKYCEKIRKTRLSTNTKKLTKPI